MSAPFNTLPLLLALLGGAVQASPATAPATLAPVATLILPPVRGPPAASL